jgi:hypothetical protein
MIYELLYPLRHSASWLGWLNVLRYVPFRVIASTMTAMLICFLLSPWFIRELQKKQIGQVVRDDGMIPDGHLKKRGTPTMGGALLLLAVLGSTVLWCDLRNVFVLGATAITAGYGVIGYLDDYLKIRMKNSKGLAARYKLLGQFVVATAVLTWIFTSKEHLPPDWWEIRDRLAIPFVAFNKHPIHLPIPVYIAFAVLTVVAMSKVLVELFVQSFKEAPSELILDFDATDDRVHGEQEGRAFHGYYGDWCFLPLYVFCGEQLLVSYLRPSNADPARHAWAILKLLVMRLRQEWPQVKISLLSGR